MLSGDDGRDQLYSPFTTMVSSSAGISSSSSRVGGMVGMECERRVVLFWGHLKRFRGARALIPATR